MSVSERDLHVREYRKSPRVLNREGFDTGGNPCVLNKWHEIDNVWALTKHNILD